LSDAWVPRGDIDIEEILQVFLKSVCLVDMKIIQIPLIIKNIMENSFLVTINTWTTKIHDAIDRSVRSTRYLYDEAKALSETKRPKTSEEMIEWVVVTM
jgi:hypothetical protein